MPFENRREEVIANARIDRQLGCGTPIILQENSEDFPVVVNVIDVVNPATIRTALSAA